MEFVESLKEMALTWMLLLPAMGALFVWLLHPNSHREIRLFALTFSLLTLALGIFVFWEFKGTKAGFEFEYEHRWIDAIGARYHVGVDGISILLVTLTAFLFPICIIASWTEIQERVKEFHICLLLLESALIGVFVALDLLLFYLFWEAMLIPMYFLIGIWGTPERRVYSAFKFLLYTLLGGVLMLVGIIVLYFHHWRATSSPTFDLLTLLQHDLSFYHQLWLFLAFAFAFAIKVPMFPFHTWLPDAHTEAPTAGSVILAGILLKMGTYGFLRFCLPLFPEASHFYAPAIIWISIVGILYGALMAWVQTDIKRLVAYSSVSHLGFITLGIFVFNETAIEGSILQMVNHGLSTGALFLLVGMIYERRHTRAMEAYGGLSKVMPSYAAFFLIALLASVGLPGLNGFVGEILILAGTFKHNWRYAIPAAFGVVLAAVYLLHLWRNVFHGPCDKPENQALRDLNNREKWLVLLPITLLMIWIGIYPQPFLRKLDGSVGQVVRQVLTVKRASQDMRFTASLAPPPALWRQGFRR